MAILSLDRWPEWNPLKCITTGCRLWRKCRYSQIITKPNIRRRMIRRITLEQFARDYALTACLLRFSVVFIKTLLFLQFFLQFFCNFIFNYFILFKNSKNLKFRFLEVKLNFFKSPGHQLSVTKKALT